MDEALSVPRRAGLSAKKEGSSNAPIRRLPEDGAAAGIYTLLAAIDTMPPVLTRAESAFDRLPEASPALST